jgi:hypothetical protein
MAASWLIGKAFQLGHESVFVGTRTEEYVMDLREILKRRGKLFN